MADLIIILILSFLGSMLALIGGVTFLYVRSWSDWLSRHSVPFAAGVLIAVSLIGLLPESVEYLGHQAYLATVLAFVAAFMFEHVLFGLHHHSHHHHHHKSRRQSSGSTWLIVIGDTIHNFIDGVAIGATYLASPGLGVITTLSTFLHEVPHEIGDFGLLLQAGWSRRKVLLVNVCSASATMLGGGLIYLMIDNKQLIGILLAVAAGIFLYLGASDFLPHIEEEKQHQRKFVMAFLIGLISMISIIYLVPHQ